MTVVNEMKRVWSSKTQICRYSDRLRNPNGIRYNYLQFQAFKVSNVKLRRRKGIICISCQSRNTCCTNFSICHNWRKREETSRHTFGNGAYFKSRINELRLTQLVMKKNLSPHEVLHFNASSGCCGCCHLKTAGDLFILKTKTSIRYWNQKGKQEDRHRDFPFWCPAVSWNPRSITVLPLWYVLCTSICFYVSISTS